METVLHLCFPWRDEGRRTVQVGPPRIFDYMRIHWISLVAALVAVACTKKPQTLFTTHSGPDLGITFQNTLVTDDTINALSFEYIYNGSGVGVGDFNKDGLPDLYFGGNQVSSQLYLNKGNLQFEDVTEKSGTATSSWVTGVAVVDINGDGLDDIYLCVGGIGTPETRKNLLFVNQGVEDGIPVFKEEAAAYGLADDSYSTMAAFFDYDKDGDLDMYLLNNWLEKFNRNNLRPRRVKGEAESTDRLYRNNGDNTFTDVSAEAGILIEGYGLGVVVCDINNDSWPDVYVSNDFLSNDLLWVNQGDGTFVNRIGDYLKHQAHNGMGADIADFNNDNLPDIVAVDMLPPGHERQKLMTPGQNYDFFHMALDMGYEPQYMRNTLQLNRGPSPDGATYLFSEIAFLAGIARTDWSWAPLFADFDNDGYKDLFVGNGYRKDVTNLDFVFFGLGGSPFGTPETRLQNLHQEVANLPDVKLPNPVYRNNGTLIFEDKTEAWGAAVPTFTNGAVYVDLDNDGDLDLVTNNIDQEVIVYENTANHLPQRHHFIRLIPESIPLNEKILVYAGGESQLVEMTPFRGFQSTVERAAHFGLGTNATVDSVLILWPDSTCTRMVSLPADTVVVYSKKTAEPMRRVATPRNMLMQRMELAAHRHQEKSPSDILSTRTLMHELSRFGPCLARGDVDGDGLDDFCVGGENGEATAIYIQQPNGTFALKQSLPPTMGDDGGALFADLDGDGDIDLYIASASPGGGLPAAPHRIYWNDGTGTFSLAEGVLPDVNTSASCVVAADIDQDGDIDLFVGGRLLEGRYPHAPRSYVLRNDGGKFTDVTEALNPALASPGMVTSAVWADVDNDGNPDLIVAGEWMPIRIFRNAGTEFVEVTDDYGLTHSSGWWNCVEVADLNGDGFVDIIAGNTGGNSFFSSSAENPVQIVVKDFDNNGSIDPIITYFNEFDRERFIVHNRLVLIDQLPKVKGRFETFTQYAVTPFKQAFTPEELEGALTLDARKLESVVMINEGGKSFRIVDLPDIAQISTVNDLVVDDINGDGHADLILIGNNYDQETLFGRFDASLGTVLLGDGAFNWTPLPHYESGFLADGNARYIELLRSGGEGKILLVSNNNGPLQFFVYGQRVEGMAQR